MTNQDSPTVAELEAIRRIALETAQAMRDRGRDVPAETARLAAATVVGWYEARAAALPSPATDPHIEAVRAAGCLHALHESCERCECPTCHAPSVLAESNGIPVRVPPRVFAHSPATTEPSALEAAKAAAVHWFVGDGELSPKHVTPESVTPLVEAIISGYLAAAWAGRSAPKEPTTENLLAARAASGCQVRQENDDGRVVYHDHALPWADECPACLTLLYRAIKGTP